MFKRLLRWLRGEAQPKYAYRFETCESCQGNGGWWRGYINDTPYNDPARFLECAICNGRGSQVAKND